MSAFYVLGIVLSAGNMEETNIILNAMLLWLIARICGTKQREVNGQLW